MTSQTRFQSRPSFRARSPGSLSFDIESPTGPDGSSEASKLEMYLSRLHSQASRVGIYLLSCLSWLVSRLDMYWFPRLQWLTLSIWCHVYCVGTWMICQYLFVWVDMQDSVDYIAFWCFNLSLASLRSATCYVFYCIVSQVAKATEKIKSKWLAALARLVLNIVGVIINEIITHVANEDKLKHAILALQALSFVFFLRYRSREDDGELVKTIALQFSRTGVRFFLKKDYVSFQIFFSVAAGSCAVLANGWFTGAKLIEHVPDVVEEFLGQRSG